MEKKVCLEEDEDCEEKSKRRLQRKNRLLSTKIEGEVEAECEEGEECKAEDPSDIDRLGSTDIIENMGIMLLFAFLLLIVCATLAIVALYVRSNPEARSTYIKIK